MEPIEKAIDAFNRGALEEAIENCNDGLRNKPLDQELRIFLLQLLCFAGNWERIQKLSEFVMTNAKEDRGKFFFATVVRQLIEAERLRAKVWNEGQVPGLLTEKDETIQAYLKLWTLDREGKTDEVNELFEKVISTLPLPNGKVGDQTVTGFSDADPMTRHIFECFVPNGGYFWLPINQVQKLEVSPASRPLDQYWLQANVTLRDSRSMYVYLPATYFESHLDDDQMYRLGRMTRWDERGGRLDRGVGRRIFMVGGEDEICALGLTQVEFQ